LRVVTLKQCIGMVHEILRANQESMSFWPWECCILLPAL
jgi:hypothetical protein